MFPQPHCVILSKGHRVRLTGLTAVALPLARHNAAFSRCSLNHFGQKERLSVYADTSRQLLPIVHLPLLTYRTETNQDMLDLSISLDGPEPSRTNSVTSARLGPRELQAVALGCLFWPGRRRWDDRISPRLISD